MTSQTFNPRPARTLWKRLVIGLGILAIVGTYWPSLEGELVLDDALSVLTNETITSLRPSSVFHPPADGPLGGRPIANFSFAIDFWLGRGNVLVYRCTNLLLHILTTMVLGCLLKRVFSTPRFQSLGEEEKWICSWGGAFLWALHPINTATVAYISQRTEILLGLAAVSTIHFWLIKVQKPTRAGWYAFLSVLTCLLGMGVKEGMAMVPITILALDCLLYDQGAFAALKNNLRHYTALAATWLFLGYLFLGTEGRGVGTSTGVSLSKYALTQSRVVWEYLQLIVWPSNLIFCRSTSAYRADRLDYPFAIITSCALVLIAVLLFRRRLSAIPLVWYAFFLAITSSFLPIGHQPMAENRVYLPSIAISVWFCYLLCKLPRLAAAFLLVGVVASLSTATVFRCNIMGDDVLLWEDNLRKAPDYVLAHDHLASAYLKRGDIGRAEAGYLKTIQLKPGYGGAYNNLAMVYEIQDRKSAAFELYRIAQTSRVAARLCAMAYICLRRGLDLPARQYIELAINNKLSEIDRLAFEGEFALRRNDTPLARDYLARASAIDADVPRVRYLKALLSLADGGLPSIIENWSVLAENNPQNATYALVYSTSHYYQKHGSKSHLTIGAEVVSRCDDPFVLRWVAEICRRSGDSETAAQLDSRREMALEENRAWATSQKVGVE